MEIETVFSFVIDAIALFPQIVVLTIASYFEITVFLVAQNQGTKSGTRKG